MANIGYTKSFLGGLAADIRKTFGAVFEYVLGNLEIGPVEEGTRATNFQWYPKKITTPSVANDEFSFTHGLERKPRLLLPVLPLNVQGAKLVRLEVTKPADTIRVYLRSPDTSAVMFVLVE